MRADIPARRRFDIECKTLENIVYEVTLDIKQRLFLLVSITSTNDGLYPFIKHVGFLTIFVKSKISHFHACRHTSTETF
jgi:hypothetical protein